MKPTKEERKLYNAIEQRLSDEDSISNDDEYLIDEICEDETIQALWLSTEDGKTFLESNGNQIFDDMVEKIKEEFEGVILTKSENSTGVFSRHIAMSTVFKKTVTEVCNNYWSEMQAEIRGYHA